MYKILIRMLHAMSNYMYRLPPFNVLRQLALGYVTFANLKSVCDSMLYIIILNIRTYEPGEWYI